MIRFKWYGVFLALLALFGLSACGGGGSSSSGGGVVPSVKGVVADGPLYNALVFLDLNENKVLDTGEPNTRTDVDGNYTLTHQDARKFPIVAIVEAGTTVDQDNPGVPVSKDYILSTPADKPAFISPLTTLVQGELEKDPTQTVDDAEQTVKGQLNLVQDASLFDNYVEQEGTSEEHQKLHTAAKILAENLATVQQKTETVLTGGGYTQDEIDALFDAIAKYVFDKVMEDLASIGSEVETKYNSPTFDPDAFDPTTDSQIVNTVYNAPPPTNTDVESKADTDGDGVTNDLDFDDDGDLVADVDDAFPLNSQESVDTDGDLIGNNADTDDDGDGWLDTDELTCGSNPLLIADVPVDTDNDQICNVVDSDDDGDNWLDTDEVSCLTDALDVTSVPTDTDGDQTCDVVDSDDDGDNWLDTAEVSCLTDPLDVASVPTDTDGDQTCDVVDSDDDGDNWLDTAEVSCLTDALDAASVPVDTDGDQICNHLDPDDDGDLWSDIDEGLCATSSIDVTSTPVDTDGDQTCNHLDSDDDGDNWSDVDEGLCQTDALDNSSTPVDTDGDQTCNYLDTDDDGDNWSDADEGLCATDALDNSSTPVDTDGDQTCNYLDTDDDGDNWSDADEAACGTVATDDSSIPVDTDGDQTCDAVDTDDDNDTLTDSQEAALGTNPLLANSDGDALDDAADRFPTDPNEWVDSDNDGYGDQFADAFPNDPSKWLPEVVNGVAANVPAGNTVFADANANMVLDAGEDFVLTTTGGAFTFNNIDVSVGPLVVLVDSVATPYVLTAPVGQTAFISPATTLIERLMAFKPALTEDWAVRFVKQQFGLGDSTADFYVDYIAESLTNADYPVIEDISLVLAELLATNEQLISAELATLYPQATVDELADYRLQGVAFRTARSLEGVLQAIDAAQSFDAAVIAGQVATEAETKFPVAMCASIFSQLVQAPATAVSLSQVVQSPGEFWIWYNEWTDNNQTNIEAEYGNVSAGAGGALTESSFDYNSATGNWDEDLSGYNEYVLQPNGQWSMVSDSAENYVLTDNGDGSTTAVNQVSGLQEEIRVTQFDLSGLPMNVTLPLSEEMPPLLDDNALFPQGSLAYWWSGEMDRDQYEVWSGDESWDNVLTFYNGSSDENVTSFSEMLSVFGYQNPMGGALWMDGGVQVQFGPDDGSQSGALYFFDNSFNSLPGSGTWGLESVYGETIMVLDVPVQYREDANDFPIYVEWADGTVKKGEKELGGYVFIEDLSFNQTAFDAVFANMDLPTVSAPAGFTEALVDNQMYNMMDVNGTTEISILTNTPTDGWADVTYYPNPYNSAVFTMTGYSWVLNGDGTLSVTPDDQTDPVTEIIFSLIQDDGPVLQVNRQEYQGAVLSLDADETWYKMTTTPPTTIPFVAADVAGLNFVDIHDFETSLVQFGTGTTGGSLANQGMDDGVTPLDLWSDSGTWSIDGNGVITWNLGVETGTIELVADNGDSLSVLFTESDGSWNTGELLKTEPFVAANLLGKKYGIDDNGSWLAFDTASMGTLQEFPEDPLAQIPDPVLFNWSVDANGVLIADFGTSYRRTIYLIAGGTATQFNIAGTFVHTTNGLIEVFNGSFTDITP